MIDKKYDFDKDLIKPITFIPRSNKTNENRNLRDIIASPAVVQKENRSILRFWINSSCLKRNLVKLDKNNSNVKEISFEFESFSGKYFWFQIINRKFKYVDIIQNSFYHDYIEKYQNSFIQNINELELENLELTSPSENLVNTICNLPNDSKHYIWLTNNIDYIKGLSGFKQESDRNGCVSIELNDKFFEIFKFPNDIDYDNIKCDYLIAQDAIDIIEDDLDVEVIMDEPFGEDKNMDDYFKRNCGLYQCGTQKTTLLIDTSKIFKVKYPEHIFNYDLIPKEWLKNKLTKEEVQESIDRNHCGIERKSISDMMKQMNYKEDTDEIWNYSSSKESWDYLCGRSGIALVRNGEPIANITYMLN